MLRYGEYSFPSDIWCVGHVLYYVRYGRLLFNTHDTKDHLRRMAAHLGPFPAQMNSAPEGARTEPSLGPLLDGVLTLDPSTRMSASEALKHLQVDGEKAFDISHGAPPTDDTHRPVETQGKKSRGRWVKK